MAYAREAVRVKVKKCELNIPPEWRKFSVDPQITSLEVLYSLLAKAFDIKSDFSIKYKAFDPAGNEIYLAVLSDWDLDAAFLRIHNLSIQTASEPCLTLHIDIKPFTEVREWEVESPSTATAPVSSSAPNVVSPSTRELITPLQQSLGVSQKYVQHMQTKLPGLIMNQMEKTFSIVQKAFNLSEETMASLPPRAPLADNEFRLFLDALGQIQRPDELRRAIFFGGIDPSLRRVVWKHILNVYPCGMNGRQRMDYMRRKSEHYYKLRDTWKNAVKHGCAAGELSYVTGMVKKDVLRTDRLHPFYAGSDDNQNIAALFNILTTYALNHPSVSYCQGMSDIASPLLVTMNDEAQAYICFCAIMERVRGNFLLDGIAMTQKFAHLTEALSFYDPEFWDYLKSQQADDLLFCYRWLLLELKREFPFEDALRMLEVQWSSLKYETSVCKELFLYEKEFVPSLAAGTEVACSPFGITPISPSYNVKLRENAYTKVCALRRQSSSASLSSLSSCMSTSSNLLNSTNILNSTKLDTSKRLNHSLDDNISRRRQRHASAKAHQSLDETKMLMLVENMAPSKNPTHHHTAQDAGDDTDDDVFINNSSNEDTPQFKFHPTNPFKEDATEELPYNELTPLRLSTDEVSLNKPIAKVFLSSSSSSITESENCTGQLKAKTPLVPASIAKLHNKNILSNYNAVSTIIAKQIANATNVGESSLKRVGSTGGHFKDLKDKIAATNKLGMSFEELSSANEKSQQKLVKNFNEFLNFAAVNKSRIADKFSVANHTNLALQRDKSKTPSPTPPYPVVQLARSGFNRSLDDSDSSSVPETSWSGSTAATAIQHINTLSNNSSLHMELNSYATTNAHTPEHATPSFKHKSTHTANLTPEDSQDQEYYTISNAITRELRLESDNLDRQVFGDAAFHDFKAQRKFDIEYEKLGKDSLDLVEDLKENEIIKCPDLSELLVRRRQRDAKARSSIEPLEHLKADHEHLMDASQYNGNMEKQEEIDALKSNPFLNDDSLLYDAAGIAHSSSFPEIIVPVAGVADTTAAPIEEVATNAADAEIAFSKTPSPQKSHCTPPILPPPFEFGGGNPFLMFLCLTLLLQHRNTIMKSGMDYNEIAMHFDKMVRKHDVTRVLNQARRMYIEYLKVQNAYSQRLKEADVNRNAAAAQHSHTPSLSNAVTRS